MGRIRRKKHGPEYHIQTDLIEYLEARGWLGEVMHGNAFQQGVPDLYIHHPKWGSRWVDCKQPKNYTFTKAQRRKWPVWDDFGVGIWILTAANQEQYDKLFGLPNWKDYCRLDGWLCGWGSDTDSQPLRYWQLHAIVAWHKQDCVCRFSTSTNGGVPPADDTVRPKWNIFC